MYKRKGEIREVLHCKKKATRIQFHLYVKRNIYINILTIIFILAPNFNMHAHDFCQIKLYNIKSNLYSSIRSIILKET